jgi:hypothetical protein
VPKRWASRRDLICRRSVRGAAPTRRPHAVFEDSLAALRRLLVLVRDLPDEARASVEAVGGVTALTESALTGIVAATQNLAKRLHAPAGKAPKDDPWQNVDR